MPDYLGRLEVQRLLLGLFFPSCLAVLGIRAGGEQEIANHGGRMGDSQSLVTLYCNFAVVEEVAPALSPVSPPISPVATSQLRGPPLYL